MTPDVQLFADGLYSTQENVQTIQGSPVRRSFNLTNSLFQTKGIDPVLLIFPTNPNYKIAADYLNAQGFGSIVGQPLAITSRVQDFGGRQSTDEADQWRALIGLRGTAWKQDWEVAYYHNENKVSGSVTAGYFSLTEYAKVVQTSNDWNPWSLTQTPEFNGQSGGGCLHRTDAHGDDQVRCVRQQDLWRGDGAACRPVAVCGRVPMVSTAVLS